MENDKKQEAESIIEKMNKESDLSKVEELIKDNRISFTYNDSQYRVRLLNLREKEELDELRRKKYNSMIQEKDSQGNYVYLRESKLIEIYKQRGDVDIDEINEQIKKLDIEDIDTQLKLGESISKNEGEVILKTYKDKIQEIKMKKRILSAQKTLLLEFSLENQFLNYVAEVITCLSLDILEEGTWKRMFTNLEEFRNYSDEKLINEAGKYSLYLQYL
jgi:hypothetical protein